MKFTTNELEMLHTACRKYGESLSEASRNVSDENDISDMLADRAKTAFDVMRKITMLIEEISEEE